MCKEGLNMSIRGKNKKQENEKQQNGLLPKISEKINSKEDIRLKNIYDRYHNGKTMIMDDLKYVCSKDPDGCKILIKNIVESRVNKGKENDSNKMEYREPVMNNTESIIKQQISSDYIPDSKTYVNDLKNGIEMMSSIKFEIGKMDEKEKMDMLNNLYQTIELIKLSKNMKYWDDKFQNKLVMYTYGDDKDFNILT
jgi:hypothetical protein